MIDKLESIIEKFTEVPNARFPTDNEWDIPTLNADMQGDFVDMPFQPWGAKGRKLKMPGTYHFYVDDYRFNALWRGNNPNQVVESGCKSVVEPNITVSLTSPKAYVIASTFCKRWLARYWQEMGIRVFVDLNVPTEFSDITLAGLPDDWRAFSTHGYTDRLEATHREYQLATWHYGSDDIIFIVYGGGKNVQEESKHMGWIWIPEASDAKRGKISDDYMKQPLIRPQPNTVPVRV